MNIQRLIEDMAVGPVPNLASRILHMAWANVSLSLAFKWPVLDLTETHEQDNVSVPVYYDARNGLLEFDAFPKENHYCKRMGSSSRVLQHMTFEGEYVVGFTAEDCNGKGPIHWHRIY